MAGGSPNPHQETLPRDSTDKVPEPMYHLVLLDDNSHTYEYVIRMLGAIFGYAPEKSFAIACVVDGEGRAIVMTAPFEEAELKQQAIHAFGADELQPDSKGSMTAIVEPASR